MTTQTATFPGLSWLRSAEAWLDDRGRAAWIAAMVLGFVLVWPLGLALLVYLIWSKRMFSCSTRRASRAARFSARAFRSSGNTAFDAYKADTIDRLEREQDEFETFLRRLRESKDKAEFDQYMSERSKAHRAEDRAEDAGQPTLPAA